MFKTLSASRHLDGVKSPGEGGEPANNSPINGDKTVAAERREAIPLFVEVVGMARFIGFLAKSLVQYMLQ